VSQPSVTDTLAELVRINSVNPAYGGPGEGEIARWVRRFFEERAIEVRDVAVWPDRPNVIARLPGRDPTRRVILEAHLDTVSVQGMTIPPFEPRVAEGKLYGRGACDTKGGLAAMLHAMAEVKSRDIIPPCEIWLAAVVDEEFSYRGVVSLCAGLAAQAAIVAEPTDLRAVIASKGVLRWRIRVNGRSAHSGQPHLGVNAITHMARVVLALEADHCRLAGSAHPMLGPATCSVGLIHGGVQVNVVPDECVIEVDRRLLPGEKADAVLAQYQNVLDELQAQHATLRAEMEPPMLIDEALATPPDSPVAQLARTVLKDMGRDDRLCGVPFGSDASKLSRHGIPSIVFGPGSIDHAHRAVEFVDVGEVQAAVDFYREFILRFP
jgi:acetylornithine deacetylase/succinyl-diaminopimelate desuccinylase family protein